jgi:hypothetical protein
VEERIDTAAILRRTFAMLRTDMTLAFVVLLALAVPMTLLDAYAPTSGAGFAYVGGVIAVFAQFMVTSRLLRRAGLMRAEGQAGRGASFFVALLLTGVGIAIGFLLLVLPGIYLWARWSLVAPLVIGEGAGVSDAISESWARTQGLVAPVASALVLINACVLGSIAISLYLYPTEGLVPPPIAAAANLLVYAPQVLTWYCTVAIYAVTNRLEPDLEQVFA